jgi:DoxX-like family
MTIISSARVETPTVSSFQLWIGRGLSALFVLFMIGDTAIKLLQLGVVADALKALGYAPELGLPIGILQVVLLLLYLVTRTSVLGAVLFTGLFGGAFAAHLRTNSPFFTHDMFGVYLGVLAWAGLWLRDARLRALLPLRR